jgi:mRNA-degrading endonuclease RelE of RelBE toxin-antitoxin system
MKKIIIYSLFLILFIFIILNFYYKFKSKKENYIVINIYFLDKINYKLIPEKFKIKNNSNEEYKTSVKYEENETIYKYKFSSYLLIFKEDFNENIIISIIFLH